MPDKSDPLISIDLKSNGGKTILYSIDDVEKWINKEKDFWNFIPQTQNRLRGQHFANIWNQQAQPWAPILQTIAQLRQSDTNTNDSNYKSLINTINNTLINAYDSKDGRVRSLHSSTPEAIFIKDYMESPLIAMYILADFIGIRLEMNFQRNEDISPMIIALSEANLFKKGITGVSKSETEALQNLRTIYDGLISSLKEQIKENESINDIAKSDFKKLHTDQDTTFNSYMKKSKETLEDITHTYDKKLALRAPVSYWTEKATEHKRLSRWFAFVFVLILLIFGVGILKEISVLFRDGKIDQKPEYWVLGLLILTASVGIWIIRIIAKLLISHIHLQRDAYERVTMLQTYLALLREGSGLTEKEKELILQRLFRPASSGLTKDDALPSPLWDILTRVK